MMGGGPSYVQQPKQTTGGSNPGSTGAGGSTVSTASSSSAASTTSSGSTGSLGSTSAVAADNAKLQADVNWLNWARGVYATASGTPTTSSSVLLADEAQCQAAYNTYINDLNAACNNLSYRISNVDITYETGSAPHGNTTTRSEPNNNAPGDGAALKALQTTLSTTQKQFADNYGATVPVSNFNPATSQLQLQKFLQQTYVPPPQLTAGANLRNVLNGLSSKQQAFIGYALYESGKGHQVPVPPADAPTWNILIGYAGENNYYLGNNGKNMGLVDANIPAPGQELPTGRGNYEAIPNTPAYIQQYHNQVADKAIAGALQTCSEAAHDHLWEDILGSFVGFLGFLPGIDAVLEAPLAAASKFLSGAVAGGGEAAAGAAGAAGAAAEAAAGAATAAGKAATKPAESAGEGAGEAGGAAGGGTKGTSGGGTDGASGSGTKGGTDGASGSGTKGKTEGSSGSGTKGTSKGSGKGASGSAGKAAGSKGTSGSAHAEVDSVQQTIKDSVQALKEQRAERTAAEQAHISEVQKEGDKLFDIAKKSKNPQETRDYLDYFNEQISPIMDNQEEALQFLDQRLVNLHLQKGDIIKLNVKGSIYEGKSVEGEYADEYKVADVAHNKGVYGYFLKPTGSDVPSGAKNIVAFRGTQPSVNAIDKAAGGGNGIPEDVDRTGIGRTSFNAIDDQFKQWVAQCKGNVVVTGHSLGGALADRFAALIPASEQVETQLITFAAAGVEHAVSSKIVCGGLRIKDPSDPVPAGGSSHPNVPVLSAKSKWYKPHTDTPFINSAFDGSAPTLAAIQGGLTVYTVGGEIGRLGIGLIVDGVVVTVDLAPTAAHIYGGANHFGNENYG